MNMKTPSLDYIKNSLLFQFAVILTTLLIITIIVISVSIVNYEKKELINARNLRGELLVQNLTISAIDAIKSNNELELISHCNSFVKNEEDLINVLIIDTNRIIIAHDQARMVGKACNSVLCKTISKSKELLISPFEFNRDILYDYSYPLISENIRLGSARIIISNNSIQIAIRDTIKKILVISLIILSLFLSVVLVFVKLTIIKPLQLISANTKTVATGDFSHRIAEKGMNEISYMVQQFNKMNSSLYNQKNELYSLLKNVKLINAERERDSLGKKSIEVINSIIHPRYCILCTIEDNNPTIKYFSGFESDSIAGQLLSLPNDIFNIVFQKQRTSKFIVATLKDTFEGFNLDLMDPTEDVLVSALVHGKMTKGLFICIGKNNKEDFTASDIRFLDIISLASAMALGNIELLDATVKGIIPESKIAGISRKLLMPKNPIKIKGIEICSYYKPTDATHGNWHGFIENKKHNELSIYIGDASGMGLPAILTATTANSFINTMKILQKDYSIQNILNSNETTGKPDENTLKSIPPAFIVNQLNNILCKDKFGQQTMTFFASTIDIKNKKIHFSNAGHEIPVLIKKRNKIPDALSSSGSRLGESINSTYGQYSKDLGSGDVIAWYTAGLTKCINPSKEHYKSMRFLRKFRELSTLSAHEICKGIITDLHEFRMKKPPVDDITLVIIKIL